jgi:hypothetical protein
MLFTAEIPIPVMQDIKTPFPFLIFKYFNLKGYKDPFPVTNNYGIVDNGAFEATFGVVNSKKIVMPKHARYFCVVPDAFNEPINMQIAKIRTYVKDRTMFVPHASNITDYGFVVSYFLSYVNQKKPKAKVLLGISYAEPFYSKNWIKAAFQRRTVVKRINDALEKLDTKHQIDIHLLGCKSIFELWLCRKFNRIISADSSLPVLHALAGKKTHLWSKKIKQPAGFITMDVNDKQKRLIQRNINFVNKVLGGPKC